MFRIHEIREMIQLIDKSSIEEFEINHNGTKIVMKKGKKEQVSIPALSTIVSLPAVPPASQGIPLKEEQVIPHAVEKPVVPPPVVDTSLYLITSPMVGTFYSKPSPEAEVYVQKGKRVEPKTVVCIVEAMKLFNEIEAEVAGEVVEVLVKDGQLVEYGQPLFSVKLT